MPAGYFDDDDEDFDTERSSGPKALRDALDKAHKEKTDLEKQLKAALEQVNDLNTKVKSTSLRDALTDAGLDPKYARFAERDGVEPTKESVEKWADENADVYSFLANRAQQGEAVEDEATDSGGGAEDVLPEGLLEALALQQRAEQSGRPSGSADIPTQLANLDPTKAKSRDELIAALEALGAPIG